MRYRAVAGQRTLDFLFACSPGDRWALARLLQELTDDPFQTGDFEEFDESGRPVQIRRTGAFLVTFWADHASREVRIVQVEKLV